MTERQRRRIARLEAVAPPAFRTRAPTPIILRQLADGLFPGMYSASDPLTKEESAYHHWVADEIEAGRWNRDVEFSEFLERFGSRVRDGQTPDTPERLRSRRAWIEPDPCEFNGRCR